MLDRLLFALLVFCCSQDLLAARNQNYPFSIESEKEGDGHRIVARNSGPAPISIRLSIVDSQYIAADRQFPVFAVVPPGGGMLYLARIRPAMAGVGYTFKTESEWILGDFNAAQSPDAVYRLPYRDGMAFRIGQAPGGPITTHISPASRYAVDIGMPAGAPVLAARDGLVIYTEANQVYGNKSPDMMDKANEVRIQHADGTIATYAHLVHGGVHVYPGQRVTAGTQIGLAGSTGYSSGPHLHFAVQTVVRAGDGLAVISLPFRFYVGNPPMVFSPQSGMLVTAQYNSPSRLLARDSPVQVTGTSQTAQVRAPGKTSDMVMYSQIPAQIRSILVGISLWEWIGGMAAVLLVLVLLDHMQQAERRREKFVFREPTLGPQPADKHTGHGLIGEKD